MDDQWRVPWEQIVKIHFETKRITLRAEELAGLDNRTYIQPIREERDAFEHVCRAMACVFGLREPAGDASYIAGNLEAARRHAVRGFFDAADWYGTVLRAGIRTRLEPYSSECIRTILPEYYPRSQVRIDEIVERIVQCREEKDASDEAGTFQEVKAYGELVLELEDIYRSVWGAVPYLEELHKEERARKRAQEQNAQKSRWRERPWSLAIGVVAGLLVLFITGVAGWLLGHYSGVNEPRTEAATPHSTPPP